MSSDLWAEFASPSPSQGGSGKQGGQASSFSFFDNVNSTPASQPAPDRGNLQWQQPHQQAAPAVSGLDEDLDDDFGDFEDAPSFTQPVTSSIAPARKPQDDPWSSLSGFSTSQQTSKLQGAPENSSSQPKDAFASDLLGLDSWGGSTSQPPPPKSNLLRKSESKPPQPLPASKPVFTQRAQTKLDKIAPDPDVLFDAGGDEDDDDFGDFETDAAPPPSINTAAVTNNMQLLDLDMQPSPKQVQNPGNTYIKQQPSSPSNKSMAPEKKKPKPAPSKLKSESPTQKQQPESDPTWNEFDDWEATTVAPPSKKSTDDGPAEGIVSSIEPSIVPEPSSGDLPPTNLPPPAPLLSLFLPILADAQTKFFKPLAAQPYHLKNRILSDDRTNDFLRGYILLGTVAARIIAGRKLRWKRDTHLSQGMRIGPASSRGTSGMKLATVDKGEMLKDDRQVLDVVRAWKEQLGRLRSAVAGANSSAAANLPAVSELPENLPVRTAKESEGALRAPRPCALCGLKREERVDKVDVAVEDSFGEWWIDQVSMHRACRNFWEQNKGNLKSR